MSNVNISISGATVFWRGTSDTEAARLQTNLTNIGLGKYAPSPVNMGHAVKAAMTSLYSKPRTLVRPDRNGFSIVEEEQTTLGLRHKVTLTVEVAQRHPDGLLAYPCDPPARDRLVSQVKAQLGLVPYTALTQCLTNIVRSLGGVALRDSGGIYWIPQVNVPRWREVVKAVQASGPVKVYCASMVADEDGVRAVCDSIREEMESEVAQINADFATGLSDKAMKSRASALAAMAKRVREYETALGVTLDTLRDGLVQTDAALIATSGEPLGGGVAAAFAGIDFD
jgi:hypothetical protein